jgi:hypothetical protein
VLEVTIFANAWVLRKPFSRQKIGEKLFCTEVKKTFFIFKLTCKTTNQSLKNVFSCFIRKFRNVLRWNDISIFLTNLTHYIFGAVPADAFRHHGHKV